MASYDICAVGHVTNDVVATADGRRRKAVGGAAFYAGVALRHLGLRTLVLTTAAERDLAAFRDQFAIHGIDVRATESPCTTAFENDYAGADGRRIQRVDAIARPFDPADLNDVDAGHFHLGPLTADEIPRDCFELIIGRGRRISLDMQGFTRRVMNGAVQPVDWPNKTEILQYVHILKANKWEAAVVAGVTDPASAARRLARMGPAEVIVTLSDKGAILCVGEEIHDIPATPVANPRDPTGCGDSFCAGYLFARLRGRTAPDSARFGAALAAGKLMHDGPFTGAVGDVEALLAG